MSDLRKPTPIAPLYDYWRSKLAGETVLTYEDQPQPGFYKRRKVRNGPWVPVAIWLHQNIDAETGELLEDEQLVCLVNGDQSDSVLNWTYCCDHPITEKKYKEMIDESEKASRGESEHPISDPYAPINLMTAPIPFGKDISQ